MKQTNKFDTTDLKLFDIVKLNAIWRAIIEVIRNVYSNVLISAVDFSVIDLFALILSLLKDRLISR